MGWSSFRDKALGVAAPVLGIAGSLLGGPAGGAIGGMLGGALGGGDDVSSSTSQAPEYLMPYLTGGDGVYPAAEATYLKNMAEGYQGQTPQQQELIRNEMARMQQSGGAQGMQNLGQQFMSGQFDSGYGSQGPGSLDPNAALQQMLSGEVNMDAISGMQQAAGNRAMVGYDDMVADAGRMFTEQINPAIRQGAQVAGQYGGTRQGLAQGQAAGQLQEQLSRNARDLTTANMDIGQNLYGQAHQDAQQLQGQAAGSVAGLNMATGAQNTQNALTGAQLGTGADALNAEQFKNQYGLAGIGQQQDQAGQQFDWDQLANYSGIIQGDSGTAKTVTTPGLSPLAGAGYGMQIGQGIGNLFGGGQPQSYQMQQGGMPQQNAFAAGGGTYYGP